MQNTNAKQNKKNRGFSLVELIVVLAVMAILIAVAVPVYTQYIEKARETKDTQYLDETARAVQLFAASNGLILSHVAIAPIVTDSEGIVLYLSDGSVYTGDLSELYRTVGTYTFETVDHTNVQYFDHQTPSAPPAGTCTHAWETVTAATCVTAGTEKCSLCEATQTVPATGHQFSSTCKTVGNMHIYTCTNPGCNYQIVKFDGESIG